MYSNALFNSRCVDLPVCTELQRFVDVGVEVVMGVKREPRGRETSEVMLIPAGWAVYWTREERLFVVRG